MGNNDKLRILIKERLGDSLTEFAKRIGYAHASSIQRYLSDSFADEPFPTKFAVNLYANIIGHGEPPITKEELDEICEYNPTDLTPNAFVNHDHNMPDRFIPVYGSAVGGVYGEFIMNKGDVLFEVMSPPNLDKSKGAYGVQIAGDSMAPRFKDGEIVLVDPNRRVIKGDDVIAQIVNKEDPDAPPLAFVKEFVSHTSERLVLNQHNPSERLEFENSKVVSVDYIAGMQRS